ncbi:unnamed protein product [Brassica napus]|uniref:(rape) hypothetical protein n=1 Tax=Brassica napus TaxID=3708 RepID=A0A816W6B4_BRANA|nr:unnamed protein product [Brassica napus]
MGASHQETQDPSQEREKGSYIQWSPEENKTLINLLLDAVASGLRDSNGTFSKFTVERRILSFLNRMHGCNKTYQHYSNRMKILKTKYLNAAELLRFSSGFGWDSTTKRFTASKEVWAEYLKAHPKFKKFCDETFEEFDDLKLIFDKNIATGTNAIGLGETTDAQTARVAETEKEQANSGEEDKKTSPLNKGDDLFTQKESVEEADELNTLTTITQKLFNLIEERETRQKQEAEQREAEKKKNNLWEAVKEVSDLEEHVRFDALINQLGMKDVACLLMNITDVLSIT